MNLKKNAFLLWLVFYCSLHALGQEPVPLSSLRSKTLPVLPGKILIDTLSIVPGSFSVDGYNSSQYHIDEIAATLTFDSLPSVANITAHYRVFRQKLNPEIRGLNYDSIRFHFLAEPVTIPAAAMQPAGFIDFKGIDADGSIGRNISFGNAQDAVVNSSMNLQLHGFIGDSLELKAAITDNNIPIQPDGNTQNLRDFDRILLQIGKKNWQASFGDIEMKENKDQFLSFYKRLQGGSFQTSNTIRGRDTNEFKIEGAVAKGKYSRNIFAGTEGNQGPYRLQGANNELYFVVLAGTERVYIDGQLLQRGEDKDYVINYNLAEVIFTARRMVQKDSRIQIEFEYADRNFLNAQFFVQDEFKRGDKWKLRVSGFSNADAKNSPIDQILSTSQIQFLSSIGDSLQRAYTNTETRESYSPGKLLYKKIDTVFNGTMHDSIYVLSADSTQDLYRVGFTYMGYGKGNYTPLLNAANGKAYRWVMPDSSGNKRGDYEPVTLLVTPKSLRIVSMAMDYKISSSLSLAGELALSERDVNLYSSADKSDNSGQAWKIGMRKEWGSIKAIGQSWKISSGAGQEFVAQAFRPVERLRNIEFLRDWSLPAEPSAADEWLSKAFISLNAPSGSRFSYEATRYARTGSYLGYRHIVEQYIKTGSWQITARMNLIQFDQEIGNGSFLRPMAEVKKIFPSLKNLELTANYQGEYNRAGLKNSDSLSASAFGFNIYQASLNSDANRPNRWSLNYFRREDQLPSGSRLQRANKSDNIQLSSTLSKNPDEQVNMVAGYRKLSIDNPILSKVRADESLLGRVEYAARWLKGIVLFNTFFETGSGQELRREFSYVEVPAGQGQYTWIDYNNNGIEELNEFEIAIYQDQKRYIRIFTPGSTYVKARYFQLNQSSEINPSLLASDSTTLGRFLRKSILSSAIQVNKKEVAGGPVFSRPFSLNLNDSNLLTYSGFISNTYYFNRSSSRWGLEATQSISSGRSLLVYGFESRKTSNMNGKIRFRLTKRWLGAFAVKSGRDVLSTDNASFQNRNYDIHRITYEPSLTYIYRSNLRIVFTWSHNKKEDRPENNLTVRGNELNTEVKYNVLSGAGITGRFAYNEITWGGSPASALSTAGFVLLDGLQPGKNYIWNLDVVKRIGKNLEMNIQYEGRKPGTGSSIHTGRAGIRAMF